jgi:molybdate transport system substrate-binding protein
MRLLALLFCLLLGIPSARADGLNVFAAASLSDAMRAVAALWQAQGHPAPHLVFASSSTLAKQIAAGAPADLFASADLKWMDYLAQRKQIAPETRLNLLGNDLVLIVPASRPQHVTIGPKFDLAALLGPGGRLAVGDPSHVPAGIYAAQALKQLGLWAAIEPRLAPAADVRAALLLVERGDAPAGIVYGTDAAAAARVMVAGTFPADSHDPIVYPFALTHAGDTPDGRALLAFMQSKAAQEVFIKRGFIME